MPTDQHYIEIIQPNRASFVQDATPAEADLVEEHFEYLKGLMPQEN
ncbi:MAG: hypothetical protein AB1644_12900 [Candidatus Zixiibacteriota bacterium]